MSNEDRQKKSQAVKEMIKAVNSQPSTKCHVALVKYYIDTESYPASALTLSQDYTPNLHETPEGFACDTFFKPNVLGPQEKEGKEIINGVVRVSLYVNLDDILGIFTAEGNKAIPLYTPSDE